MKLLPAAWHSGVYTRAERENALFHQDGLGRDSDLDPGGIRGAGWRLGVQKRRGSGVWSLIDFTTWTKKGIAILLGLYRKEDAIRGG